MAESLKEQWRVGYLLGCLRRYGFDCTPLLTQDPAMRFTDQIKVVIDGMVFVITLEPNDG